MPVDMMVAAERQAPPCCPFRQSLSFLFDIHIIIMLITGHYYRILICSRLFIHINTHLALT
jgi:hypothetical protein